MLKKIYQAEQLSIALLLGFGITILFWQVVFLGYVQVPADIPAFYDPVMQEAVSEIVPPQNPLLSDHVTQFYVWHYLTAKAMQETGQIPLWNPYILAGQPLVANAQPALFYPPNWLLFVLDPGTVTAVRSMFNLFVAGFFTFLFGRTLRISKLGASLAAIAFAFSGALIVGPSHAYANCLVWLPFLMWSGEKILGQSRIYFWGLVASIGVGLSILGGHPESAFHNLLVFGLYGAARLLFLEANGRVKLRLAAAFALALVVGLLLSAVQWLPFVAWWGQSATLSRSAAYGGESIFYYGDWPAHLATLVTLLFPGFFGHPVDYTYRWPFATFQNYLEQSMYIGLTPIALAVGALFARWKRSRLTAVILAVLALLMLAVALRLPVFEAINHLPIFDKVNNTRLKWYFSFLAAILAGFGLDEFGAALSGRSDGRKRVLYAVTAVLAAALVIVSGVVVGKYGGTAVADFPVDSFAYHLLFTIFSLSQLRTTISLLVLFIAGGAILYALRQGPVANIGNLQRLFVGLTFVELIVLGYGYNTTVPRETVFPAVTLTNTLQQDPEVFRIAASPPTFWPNYGAVYGLYDVGGYDLPVYRRYAKIYEAQGGSGYRQAWPPEWPLLDWMNVKYVISPQPYDLEKLELVLAKSYWVYRNRDVLPRAYMVYEAQVAADENVLLDMMTRGDFPFAEKVLLEAALPPEQATAVTPPTNPDTAVSQTVQFTQFTNDKVVLDVFTEAPGLLVMSDVYTPGWQALLDGKPVALHRANYTFRAVFVPAGSHQVTFFYKPLDFEMGRMLSLLGLLILLIGLPALWITGRPKTQSA